MVRISDCCKNEIELAVYEFFHCFGNNGDNRYRPIVIHVRFNTFFINWRDSSNFPVTYENAG